MEEKRKFTGIWLPVELWTKEDLSIQEKCFIAEIHSLDNEEGCIASNSHFSEIFNLSKNRCSSIINSLEEKGIISIDYEYDGKEIKKRRIRLNKLFGLSKCKVFDIQDRYSENDKGGIPKMMIGYSENCEDRITIENNNKEIYNDDFEKFWSKYPRHDCSKQMAKKSYISAVKNNKATPEIILSGLDKYCKQIKRCKTENKFIKHAATWLNNQCWNDEYETPAKKAAEDRGWRLF